MTIAALHDHFLAHGAVCTDTRKLNPGDLFFALKGPSFNGNEFADQALNNGASLAVVDDPAKVRDNRYVLVPDVLQTLQDLANYHRRSLEARIIGLTGSNGKTTTKELIQRVLSARYKTAATSGNLNNHIGVPLTLLSMDSTTEIGIVEMGANHIGEIADLCAIAEPDFGYITNFGKAHLEGFGSVEGVIRGKSELYQFLKQNDKTIFVNSNDPIQLRQLGDYNACHAFGTRGSDKSIALVSDDPYVQTTFNGLQIDSALIGAYNFNNISAAIAIGDYFGVAATDIKSAIESYTPENNRSQIVTRGSLKIILDAYNANPTSMKAALDSFAKLSDRHKSVILGDMFELGPEAATEHQAIADYVIGLDLEAIYLVGEHFYEIRTQAKNLKKFRTFESLDKALDLNALDDQTILIKGSRGMALERILD